MSVYEAVSRRSESNSVSWSGRSYPALTNTLNLRLERKKKPILFPDHSDNYQVMLDQIYIYIYIRIFGVWFKHDVPDPPQKKTYSKNDDVTRTSKSQWHLKIRKVNCIRPNQARQTRADTASAPGGKTVNVRNALYTKSGVTLGQSIR